MTAYWDFFSDPHMQALVVFGPLLFICVALVFWPRKGERR